jgi:hypothetical protein
VTSNLKVTIRIKSIVHQIAGLLLQKKKLCKGTKFLKHSPELARIGSVLVVVELLLASTTM